LRGVAIRKKKKESTTKLGGEEIEPTLRGGGELKVNRYCNSGAKHSLDILFRKHRTGNRIQKKEGGKAAVRSPKKTKPRPMRKPKKLKPPPRTFGGG